MLATAIVILSLCLSLCLSHLWSMHKQFNLSKYFVHHTIGVVLLVFWAKFRSSEFLGSSWMSGLNGDTPVKVILWPIHHDNLETVWDRIWLSTLLFINRKLHMGFRLVAKFLTLDDLETTGGRHYALFHTARHLWRQLYQIHWS